MEATTHRVAARPQSSAMTTTGNKRPLAVIFFIMLMDIIGLSILIPVAPYIVQQYSGEAVMVTMVTVLYAAAQFFAAPVLGKLGDRYGRRPVLLISVLGSAIGYVLFGVGGALWVLFLARLIDGFTGGNLSTASAYIADVSKPEERAKNFTLIGMAYGFGFILGPALGAAFSKISLNAPMFAAAALSMVGVTMIYFFLPESLPKERRETAPIRPNDLNPISSIGVLARKPGLGWVLVVTCLFEFAFNGVNSTSVLFMMNKFTVEPWQVGLLFVLVGIATAVAQAVLIPRLVPRYGEKTMTVVGLLGNGLSGLAVFFAPVFWLIYPIYVVGSAIGGFCFATLGALAANGVSEREQGMLMGVNAALTSLMTIFGPLCAGAVYDRIMPGAPYWLGAVIFGIACPAILQVKTPKASSANNWVKPQQVTEPQV